MKLFQLLLRLDYELLQGTIDREIRKVTNDTRMVQPQDVFVCIKGFYHDSHQLVTEAIRAGAAAVVVEKVSCYESLELFEDITVILVESTQYALAIMAAASFNYPAESIKMIGVTGTKGKTSVACMVHQILKEAGIKAGLIGTIQVDTGLHIYQNKNTTPDALELQSYLYEMKESGCEYAVMEVSSQGLKHQRVAGITFEIGVFTNIEADHIGPGEHRDFQEYLWWKQQLFFNSKMIIANRDDKIFDQMFAENPRRIQTFGIKKEADYQAFDVNLTKSNDTYGTAFKYRFQQEEYEINLLLPGAFQVYNALAAIAVLRATGIPHSQIISGLNRVELNGRTEKIGNYKGCMLYIDYAHNGMSLRSVLENFRMYCPKRIILIFGCGGNRSRERRYAMGEAAGRFADYSVITTDNPRDEDPQMIISEIVEGIVKTDGAYCVIPDRKEAIRYALEYCEAGDLILVAGKGHETYQEIKGIRYEMDDRKLINEIIRETEDKNRH